MVILFFLLGVSAKHFREDVSTTVSQKDTTGSATFTSMSAYSSRKSCSIRGGLEDVIVEVLKESVQLICSHT